MPWAAEEVGAMLAVNGAVRLLVVAHKLMMSTVSYIHT